MMRILLLLIAVVLLLYLLYAGYFYLNQRAILFPRHLITIPTTPDLPTVQQMWLDTSEGRVEAWYLPPLGEAQTAPAPLCIIAHGNGDLIDGWLSSVTALRETGVGVFLVEYPGYGRSEGSPSYAAIRETYLLAYDTIIQHPQVDPQRVLLFGHSLGGGAVAALAAERPSVGMILFSTFTSVPALAAEQWLPGFAVQDVFNTLEVVQRYPHPILVFHGKYDRTIPYHHGVALDAAAQDGELISLECGHGGCVEDWQTFWRDLRPFLVRTGILS